jgi:hypothetical protein
MIPTLTIVAAASQCSTPLSTLEQSFYSRLQAGQRSDALNAGRAAIACGADDRFTLDVAYQLLNSPDKNEGVALLQRLSHSPRPDVAKAAQRQLAAMSGSGAAGSSSDSVFGYTQYDSRYADTFYGFDAYHMFKSNSALTPYVVLHFTDDARSGAPGVTQVFSDDAAVTSAGVRLRIDPHAYVFAEGGQSFGLRGRKDLAEDRYGAGYYNEFGRPGGSDTMVNATAAVYSRFGGNAIAYATVEHRVPAGALTALAGVNAAADSQGLYYNNFAEGYAGLEYRVVPGVWLRVVDVAGLYHQRGEIRATLRFGVTH